MPSHSPRRQLILPILAAAIVGAGFVARSLTLRSQETVALESGTEERARELAWTCQHLVDTCVRELRTLARVHSERYPPNQAQFDLEAFIVISGQESLQAVQYITPKGLVLWVVPYAGNEASVNFRLSDEVLHDDVLTRAREGHPVSSRNLELVQGGTGFAILVPISRGNNVTGFICGVFRTDRFLAEAARVVAEGVEYRAFIAEQLASRADPWDAPDGPSVTEEFDILDIPWRLEVRPNDAFVAKTDQISDTIVLYVGALAAALTWLATYMTLRARARSRAVRDANERLVATVAELAASETRLRRLNVRLQEVREDERLAISRELHDEWGQRLTAMRLELRWLAERVEGEALRRVGDLTRLVERTLNDVREVAHRLRPSVLDELGLIDAVRDYVEGYGRRAGLPVSLSLADGELPPDRDRDVAVFRIVQEALTNVARHAQAGGITVTLARKNGHLTLTVEDDGRGVPESVANRMNTLGLAGMRERATAIGGELVVGPGNGGGTRVRLRVPLVQEGEASA